MLLQRFSSMVLILTEPHHFKLLSFPGSFLPLRIFGVQISDEVELLLLQFLAHLKQLVCAIVLLIYAVPDISEKIFVPGLALDFLNFDVSDLVLKLLSFDLMESSSVFFPLRHLLLKDIPLKVDGSISLLQLLQSMVSVHYI